MEEAPLLLIHAHGTVGSAEATVAPPPPEGLPVAWGDGDGRDAGVGASANPAIPAAPTTLASANADPELDEDGCGVSGFCGFCGGGVGAGVGTVDG